jgi:phosphonate transport system permease protein
VSAPQANSAKPNDPFSAMPSIDGTPTSLPPPDLKWYQRLNLLNFTLILFILGAIASSGVLKGSGRDIDELGRTADLARRMFPPDFSVWPAAMQGLLETVQIAIWATLIATLAAIPLALATSSTISSAWIGLPVRLFMNMIRTIPNIIWALIAVNIVGPNPLAGVIGLTFYSMGYMVKFFSDAVESADMKVFKSLRAAGASGIQAFQHGLWPQIKPQWWSSVLFMFEYNIRSGSIIGFVGAGGIGVVFHSRSEFGWWDQFMAVVLILLVPVTLLDLLGTWTRNKLTRRKPLEEAAD